MGEDTHRLGGALGLVPACVGVTGVQCAETRQTLQGHARSSKRGVRRGWWEQGAKALGLPGDDLGGKVHLFHPRVLENMTIRLQQADIWWHGAQPARTLLREKNAPHTSYGAPGSLRRQPQTLVLALWCETQP